MTHPEKEPCRTCSGTRILKRIRDGFTVTEDCPRCRDTDGMEQGPTERELEDAGQVSIFGEGL